MSAHWGNKGLQVTFLPRKLLVSTFFSTTYAAVMSLYIINSHKTNNGKMNLRVCISILFFSSLHFVHANKIQLNGEHAENCSFVP